MTDRAMTEQVEQPVDESNRGSGRTTRAVLRALLEAAGGRRVAFIARTVLHADAARVSACVAAKSLGIGCQLRRGQVLDFSFGGSIVFVVEGSATAGTATEVTIRDLDEKECKAKSAMTDRVTTEQVRQRVTELRSTSNPDERSADMLERLAAGRDELQKEIDWWRQHGVPQDDADKIRQAQKDLLARTEKAEAERDRLAAIMADIKQDIESHFSEAELTGSESFLGSIRDKAARAATKETE